MKTDRRVRARRGAVWILFLTVAAGYAPANARARSTTLDDLGRRILHALTEAVGDALARAGATETENLGIRILRAERPLAIDGRLDDWDLSGGVFTAGNVEAQRDTLAAWLHAMYDEDHLYVGVRWIDETPLNNPGSVTGDAGFHGDSLQLRLILNPDGPGKPAISWVTAWRDKDGHDLIDVTFPKGGGESLPDAGSKGARQAFVTNADGTGYVQELALPWSLLGPESFAPAPGSRLVVSVEANFSTAAGVRVSLKDLFRPGVTPNRVFTFDAPDCWAFGVLGDRGPVAPQPVRLADAREFQVRMEAGAPVVDWTGLDRAAALPALATIPITLPQDGHVSLNILDDSGRVVRQLLTNTFFSAGTHDVAWDGRGNPGVREPGTRLPSGTYTWTAIWHTGIGLRLVGWAHNAGRAPVDTPGGNWGGDHGNPSAVDADADTVYLGWSASEAGRSVVATDLDGNVKWRHKRGGFGGASRLAADAGIVYVYDRQPGSNLIYRLDARNGRYSPWEGSASAELDVQALLKPAVAKTGDTQLSGLAASSGKIAVSLRSANLVAIVDGATGRLDTVITVPGPGDVEAGPGGEFYVLADDTRIVRIDAASRAARTVVANLQHASALALDAAGRIYVGLGDPSNRVVVYGPGGRALRSIGRPGGRALLGPWQQDGMRFIRGLRVDGRNRLWVMEDDDTPRRISVWDTQTGSFVQEFFGATNYGAVGGAINPLDPLSMVGQGAEWRLDPVTGRARCVGVFHRGAMNTARFGVGAAGRLYLAVGGSWETYTPVHIYERLGPGRWKLRTTLEALADGATATGIRMWADANDDGKIQETEVQTQNLPIGTWVNGWYTPMTPSLTFYGGAYRIGVTGYTPCGSPVFDLAKATRLPAPPDVSERGGAGARWGSGSADDRLVLYNGRYNTDLSDFQCFEIETGELKWTYPNTFVGVHGGHRAPPARAGLIRAAYDIVGSATLPDPIGNIFVIATDKGEWHVLTGDGYYLTRLFEGDPSKIQWPDAWVPGAVMDQAPPGSGGEDFGGSVTVASDGQLYVQAGKTAFVNLRVTGLDSVRRLGRGTVSLSTSPAPVAEPSTPEPAPPTKSLTVARASVSFTGDVASDFAAAMPPRSFGGQASVAVAYDEANLYVGWEVDDLTPWVNGATEPAVMYASGDTVDLQLGTDPGADPERSEAVAGDLRLSIGNFQGVATAVIYRRVSDDTAPRTFYSGTARDGYVMASVRVLANAVVRVAVGRERYVVEAAIPLKAIGVDARPGMTLRADFGVTRGDLSGTDTAQRTYWSNPDTGQVSDEVFELKMEPRRWGRLIFRF